MGTKEKRAYLCEVRAEENKDIGTALITGRPIVYNSPTIIGGEFEEIIHEGAVTTQAMKDVPFVVNHDASMIPLARSRNNNENSTLRLQADEKGVYFEAEIDVKENATARELYSAISRGDIDGMSFCFSVSREEWEGLDSDKPVRHIYEIDWIGEISAVTWPAYDSTSINARSRETLESARRALESVQAEKRSEDLKLAKLKAIAKFKF